VLDRGSIETVGPFGFERSLVGVSKYLGGLSISVITNYALFIFISFIIYLLFPLILAAKISLLLLIIISIPTFNYNEEVK
jgi:NADH-ubiquinone oxidoreductase chain 5